MYHLFMDSIDSFPSYVYIDISEGRIRRDNHLINSKAELAYTFLTEIALSLVDEKYSRGTPIHTHRYTGTTWQNSLE